MRERKGNEPMQTSAAYSCPRQGCGGISQEMPRVVSEMGIGGAGQSPKEPEMSSLFP